MFMDISAFTTLAKMLPTLIFLVCLILYIIVGCIRGFKKSFILLINGLICAALAFGFYYYMTQNPSFGDMLYHNAPGSILETVGVKSNLATLNEAIIDFVKTNVCDNESSMVVVDDMQAYIIACASIILNAVYFIVSLVCYLCLVFIFFIGYLCIFRRKVKASSKKRFLGSIINGLRGVVWASVWISFLGSLAFIANGGTEKRDTEQFGNDKYSNYIDYLSLFQAFGEDPICKAYGMAKDSSDVPYYLYISDQLIKGNYTVDGTQVTINVRDELSTYVGNTLDLYTLLNKYGVSLEDLTNASGDDINRIMNELFSNEEFVGEFESYITNFKTPEFTKNLVFSLVDNICTKSDVYFAALGYENKEVSGLFKAFFDQEVGIKPSNISSEKDVKLVLNMTLNYYSSFIVKEKEPVFTDYLGFIKDNYTSIKDLTMFTNDDSKTKLNQVLGNTIEYSLNTFVFEEPITLNFTSDLDWIKEVESLIDIANDYSGEEVNLDFNAPMDTINTLIKHKSDFNDLINYACNSEIINAVLSSPFMMSKMEEGLSDNFGYAVVLPDDIVWDSKGGEKGELEHYFDSIDSLGDINLSSFDTTNPAKSFIDLMKQIDDEKFDNTIDNLLDSCVFNYLLNAIIKNTKFTINEKDYELYISDNMQSYVTINDSEYSLVKKEYLKETLSCLPTFGDLLYDEDGNMKEMNVDLLCDPSVKEILMRSRIIEGTVVNIAYDTISTSKEIGEYVYIPSNLDLSVEGNILNWMSSENTQGELVNMLDVINSTNLLEISKSSDVLNSLLDNLDTITTELPKSRVLEGTVSNLAYHYLTTDETVGEYVYTPIDLDLSNKDNIVNWMSKDGAPGELINILTIVKETDIINIAKGSDVLTGMLDNLDTIIAEVPKSRVLEGTASNLAYHYLSTDESIGKYVYAPAYLDLSVEGNIQNWMTNDGMPGELVNMLTALKKCNLTDISSSDKLIYNILTSDENFVTNLYSSSIIKYTFSNVLRDTILDERELLIPNECYDYDIIEDFNILKNTDLQAFIDCMKVLLPVNTEAKTVDYSNLSLDLLNILSEDNAKKETTLNSKIFVTNAVDLLITESETTALKIPAKLKTESLVNDYSDSLWISKNEFSNLFEIINVLEISVVDGEVSFDKNIILSLNEACDEDNSKLDVLYQSSIAALTVTSNVDGSFYIPASSYVKEFDYIDEDVLAKSEVSNLCNTLTVLGVSDINDVENINKDQILNSLDGLNDAEKIEKINSMIASDIAYYYYSNSICSALADKIYADVYSDDTSLTLTNPEIKGEKVIIRQEFVNLVLSFDYLNVTTVNSLDTFDGKFEDLRYVVITYKSTIVHDFISDEVGKEFTVPDAVKVALAANTNRITEEEIIKMLNALHSVNYSFSASFNPNLISIDTLVDSVYIDEGSVIIKYAISNSINEVLDVLAIDMDQTYGVNIITVEEFDRYMFVLKKLGITDLSTSISAEDIIAHKNDSDFDKVLECNIIWLFLSNYFIDRKKPSSGNRVTVYSKKVIVNSKDVITKEEMNIYLATM